MKSIYELLLESEQLRLETDDAGPQVGFSEGSDQILIKFSEGSDQMFRTSWNTGRAGRPGSASWSIRFFKMLAFSHSFEMIMSILVMLLILLPIRSAQMLVKW